MVGVFPEVEEIDDVVNDREIKGEIIFVEENLIAIDVKAIEVKDKMIKSIGAKKISFSVLDYVCSPFYFSLEKIKSIFEEFFILAWVTRREYMNIIQ